MREEKYITGTKEDHTHIKFFYDKHTMIVNDFTYKHVYPNEKDHAIKYKYLKKVNQ